MPLDIPDGWAHVAIQHNGAGDPTPWFVTFGVNCGDAPTVQELGERALSAYKFFAESRLGSHVSIPGCMVTKGTGEEPIRQFVNNPGGAFVGDRTTASLPQNCALLIDKNTSQGGRKHQGRFFIPGALAEGDVDNVGVIAPAVVTAWQDAATSFVINLQSVLAAPFDWVMPMVVLHNNAETLDPPPTNVTSLTVQTVISTQRRRLR